MKKFGKIIKESQEEENAIREIAKRLEEAEINNKLDLMNFYSDLRTEGFDGMAIFKVFESHPKCKGIWDTWD